MTTDMLSVVADVYRERGPLQQQVPVRSFLEAMRQCDVEEQLGVLLEAGALVPGSGGTIALAARLRLPLVTRTVLSAWVDEAVAAPAPVEALLRAAIRAELRELVRYARTTTVQASVGQRAAELAGVLAMSDLDPRAMDVIAGLAGTVRSRHEDLAAIPEGCCRSLKELQARMRRFVTTQFLDGASTG